MLWTGLLGHILYLSVCGTTEKINENYSFYTFILLPKHFICTKYILHSKHNRGAVTEGQFSIDIYFFALFCSSYYVHNIVCSIQ